MMDGDNCQAACPNRLLCSSYSVDPKAVNSACKY